MHGYEAWTTKIATKETGGNKKCSQKENAMNLTDKEEFKRNLVTCG